MADVLLSIGIEVDEARRGHDQIIAWNTDIANSYARVTEAVGKVTPAQSRVIAEIERTKRAELDAANIAESNAIKAEQNALRREAAERRVAATVKSAADIATNADQKRAKSLQDLTNALFPLEAQQRKLIEQLRQWDAAMLKGQITNEQWQKGAAVLKDRMDNLGQSTHATSTGMSTMRGIVGQAGLQIADLAIVSQMGSQAIGQMGIQVGQFLGVIGPTGAVVGAAVTILGVLAGTYYNLSKEQDTAEEAQKKFNAALDAANPILNRHIDLQERLMNLPKGSSQIGASYASTLDLSEDEIKKREKLLSSGKLSFQEIIDTKNEINLLKSSVVSVKRLITEIPATELSMKLGDINDKRNEELEITKLVTSGREREAAILRAEISVKEKLAGVSEELAREEVKAARINAGKIYDLEQEKKARDEAEKEAERQSKEKERRTKREIEQLERASEAEKQKYDNVIKSSDEYVASLINEASTVSLTEREAAIHRAGMKVEVDLRKVNNGLIKEEGQARIDAAKIAAGILFDEQKAKKDSEKDEKDRIKQIEKNERERERIVGRATDKIVDYGQNVFEKWLNGEKSSWQDFWDDAVKMSTSAFAQMASEALIRPIVQPVIANVVSSLGLGSDGLTASQGIGLAGLAGLGGSFINAASGGKSKGGNLLGLGSVALSGYELWKGGTGYIGANTSLMGSQMFGMALPEAQAVALSAQGVGSYDAAMGVYTSAGGEVLPVSSTALGAADFLGIAGAGLNNITAFTGGNAAQKVLTPVGTAAGAVLGSAFGLGPYIGAGIGSTIGNILGGVFGGKGKSVEHPYSVQKLLAGPQGVGIDWAVAGAGGSYDQSSMLGRVGVRGLTSLLNSLGISPTSVGRYGVGYNQEGSFSPDAEAASYLIRLAKSGKVQSGLYGLPSDAAYFSSGKAGGYAASLVGAPSQSRGLDPWVLSAMAQSKAKTTEELQKDIATAEKLRETVNALIPFRDALVVVDEQTRKTTRSMIDEFRSVVLQAEQYGGGSKAADTVKQRLEAMVKGETLIDDSASAVEKSLQAIYSQFDVLADGLREFGGDVSLVAAGIEKQTVKLRDDYNKTQNALLAQFTGDPTAGWDVLIEQQKEGLKDAILLGADLSTVQAVNFYQQRDFLMKLSATQRAQLNLGNDVLTQSVNTISNIQSQVSSWGKWQSDLSKNAATLADTFKQLASSLSESRIGFRQGDLSTLTPEQRLAEARSAFEQTSMLAQGGDKEAMGVLAQRAEALLTASQAFNANNATYQSDFNEVMNILASVGDVATNQAAYQDAVAAKLGTMAEILKAIDGNIGATGAQATILNQLLDIYSIGNGLAANTEFSTSLIAELSSRGITISDDIRNLISSGDAQAPTIDAIYAANDDLISQMRTLPTDIVSEMQARPIIDLAPLIAAVNAEKAQREAALLAEKVTRYNQQQEVPNLAAAFQNASYQRALLSGGSTTLTQEINSRISGLTSQKNRGDISQQEFYDLVEQAYQFGMDNATSAAQWNQYATAKLSYDRTEDLANAAQWRKDMIAGGWNSADINADYNAWVKDINASFTVEAQNIQAGYQERLAGQRTEIAAIDQYISALKKQATLRGMTLTYNVADKFDDVLMMTDAGTVVQSLINELGSQFFDINSALGNRLTDYAKSSMNTSSYWGENAPKFAIGGRVTGPGTGTSDSIAAMLSDGEYVINANATNKWLPFLDYINSGGDIPTFAMGGTVGGDMFIPSIPTANDNSSKLVLEGIRSENKELKEHLKALNAEMARLNRLVADGNNDRKIGNNDRKEASNMLRRAVS